QSNLRNISALRSANLADRITSERANKRQKVSNDFAAKRSGSGTMGSGTSTTTRYDETPLTDGQRKFLDQNIGKGGGIIVSDAVQNKSEWVKEAFQKSLCIKCAGAGHYKAHCPAVRRST